MGMVLENKVLALKKDDEYNVTFAFTNKNLISAKCSCHSGGHDDERVSCVHSLPLLYQFAMLLENGLAEHMLVDLCSQWNTKLKDLVQKQRVIWTNEKWYRNIDEA